MKEFNTLDYLGRLSLFLFLSSIVIFTIYLAALGWPVLKYRIVQSWTGLEQPNQMVSVLKFNEGLDPLPMDALDDTPVTPVPVRKPQL